MSHPIVSTNIVGGLGNQLFLVANLIATARRHKKHLVAPILRRVPFSDSCGPPRPVYWDTLFASLPHTAGVTLSETDILSSLSDSQISSIGETRPVAPILLPLGATKLSSSSHIYNLVGFFQAPAFFEDCVSKAELAHIFLSSHDTLMDDVKKHLVVNYITSDATSVGDGVLQPDAVLDTVQTIALHVRRGDYLSMRDVFEVLEFEYYDKALKTLCGRALHKETFRLAAGSRSLGDIMFPTRHQNIRVLIFSEDATHAKTLAGALMTKYPGVAARHVAVEHERFPFRSTSSAVVSWPREVVELAMMSLCDDVVVANSSFSWWGAYLNILPNHRVVAPLKWFVKDPFPRSSHVYPADWMLL